MLSNEERQARLTSTYVDALLASGEGPAAADLDPALRRAARRLQADLAPVHPSFRFQESLAAKLAAAARDPRNGDPRNTDDPAAPGFAQLIVMPVVTDPPGQALGSVPRRIRPFIVGGVAASALSLGAVFVAWRFTRPGAPGSAASFAAAVPVIAASAASAAASAPAVSAATTVVSRSLSRRRNGVLHGILGVVS